MAARARPSNGNTARLRGLIFLIAAALLLTSFISLMGVPGLTREEPPSASLARAARGGWAALPPLRAGASANARAGAAGGADAEGTGTGIPGGTRGGAAPVFEPRLEHAPDGLGTSPEVSRYLQHWARHLPPNRTRKFYSQLSRSGVEGRYLQSLGWWWTRELSDAEMLFVHNRKNLNFSAVQPWQLPCRLQRENVLSHKGKLLTSIHNIKRRFPDAYTDFLPETYKLSLRQGRADFLSAASASTVVDGNGTRKLAFPWVIKVPHLDSGKGISFLSSAAAMDSFVASVLAGNETDKIAQRYITNLLTLPDGRKFDLRVHWFVASIDPVLVYFRWGTVRATATPLNLEESGWADPRAHMTNFKVQKARVDGTDGNDTVADVADLRLSAEQLRRVLEDAFPQHPDPFGAVGCQIKRALATTFESARKRMTQEHYVTANAFSLLGADFMIDKNLHVWLTEVQSGPGVALGTPVGKALWEAMAQETMDLVIEIREKQAAGVPVLPLNVPPAMEPIVQGNQWHHRLSECDMLNR